MRRACEVAVALAALGTVARGVQLSNDKVNQVYSVMQDISVYSWENGTESQAALEWSYPTYSVFTTTGNPFPSSLSTKDISQVVQIAQVTLQNRPSTNTSGIMGGSSLLQDDAAADPASLGIAVMLANVSTGNEQVNGIGYAQAADDELNYLLYNVPRAPNGAISHRADQVQLWSDFVSMVPPFLAYYGAMTNNQSLLQASYDQISAYRSVLKQSNGLWAHIMLGNGTLDPGLWATGNGWAAYGMLRVYATIEKSNFAGQMQSQLSDLRSWMGEILGGCQQYVAPQGLLHNYINDSTSFLDSTGSALIAASGYRMALLNITSSYVPMSNTLLSAVSANVNSSGYLTQVVNPLNFNEQGTESPEGQAFVVIAYSAFNLWDKSGQPGGNGSSSPLGPASGALALAVPGRWWAAAAALAAGGLAMLL